MMTNTNLQSRFQVIQHSTALPGSCVTCGGSNGPFIDFGFLAEYYGAIIFCVPCAQDCGRSAGLIDSERLEETNQQLVFAEATVDKLTSFVDEFRGTVDVAVSVLHTRCNEFVVDNVLDSSSNTESETSNTEELGTATSDVEFISSEGSDGVSSAPSNDDSFFNDGSTSKSK